MTPSGFDGQIAAVPVTLLSRDEDAHHPHHPLHLLSRHAPSSRRPVSSKHVTTTAAPPLRFPGHVRPTELIRLTPQPLAEKPPPVNARVLTPRADDSPLVVAVNEAHAKFLVCAGHAMNVESPRTNNNDEREATVTSMPPATSTVSQANDVPRPLPGLQRSDSELELIISELREKMALQHRSQSPQSEDEDNDDIQGNARGNQHSRKHLKNPLEKMLMTSASTTSVQLRRQASMSYVNATRLVREGSATMISPIVLASSTSRSALSSSGGLAHSNSPLVDSKDVHPASQEPGDPVDGFRIRAYTSGSEHHTSANPAFTSSTSLGQHLSPTAPMPPRVLSPESTNLASRSSLLRPSRSRDRTLAGLDLELTRLNAFQSGGGLSPVGPWALDDAAIGLLATSRSTASLTSNSSMNELVLPTPEEPGELSPRSRLLWLSDCSSEDGWTTTSERVMAMLRPGCQQRGFGQARPASAAEVRRPHSKSKSLSTPGKARATSAKASASNSRRPSEACGPHDIGNKQQITKPPGRVAQRPLSGSGSGNSGNSSSSTSSSCNTVPGRMLIPQRGSFRA